MNLTVIIPSKNAANLSASLTAVAKHEPNARVIVVDDGVAPESVPWLQSISPKIEFVKGRKPFVFSININIGLRAAGESDVVLLNDDAILESRGGFSLMQKSAQDHPEYGIIGAVTNLTGQPLQRPLQPIHPEYGLRETHHIAFVCCLITWNARERIRGRDGNEYAIAEADHVYTGGFLDERYCVGYGSEDLDMCMQVEAAGMKVGVHDGCYVDHGSLTSSFRGAPTAAGDIWPNHRILRKKWGLLPAYHPGDPEGRK